MKDMIACSALRAARGNWHKGSPSTLKTGYAPYAIAGSPDGKFIAVSNWGDQSISIFDRVSGKEIRLAVGSHPNELVWSKDGRLYVACSGSNSVSVVQDGKVTETIKTCLDPAAPVGSTPIALAISSDQQRLYVANADNNDVAVIDISQAGQSRILGLIPTGWYPSALAVSPDSKTLYVGVGKGMAFAANPSGDYIGDILNGAIEVIAVPDQAQLGLYTRQVIANTPASERQMKLSNSQQAILKNVFPQIKHVLWIIRENRTYDQILGDLPYGNGDPSLAIFGKDVTPNAHALAQEFTLLDNLYCSGEVSEDGHEWCNAAYATDFTEKAWINSYSDRGEPDSDDRLTKSPAGYLWDNCRKNNVTYRSYGEYAAIQQRQKSCRQFSMATRVWKATLRWPGRFWTASATTNVWRPSLANYAMPKRAETGQRIWSCPLVRIIPGAARQTGLPPMRASPPTIRPWERSLKRFRTQSSGPAPQSS